MAPDPVSPRPSGAQPLQMLAKRVTCSELHDGTLCADCRREGNGCLRLWALNREWPPNLTPADLPGVGSAQLHELIAEIHKQIDWLKSKCVNVDNIDGTQKSLEHCAIYTFVEYSDAMHALLFVKQKAKAALSAAARAPQPEE